MSFRASVSRCRPLLLRVKATSSAPKPLQRNLWNGARWLMPRQNRFVDFPEVSSIFRFVNREMLAMERMMDRIFDDLGPLHRSTGERQIPVQVAGDGKRSFKVQVDVSQFKPEEVQVTIRHGVLSIEAVQKETSSDGGRSYHMISRQYTLPEDLDPEAVKSVLGSDGVLVVEASLPVAESPKERVVPIDVEGKENEPTEGK